jgi:hypothetical protein
VNVGIYEPRKNCHVAKIMSFSLRRNPVKINDVSDQLSFHEQRGGTHLTCGHHSA